MKKQIRTLHSLIIGASILHGANLHAAAPFFVQQPETMIAEVGTFVAFSARIAPQTNAVYQWKIDGTNIPNATNRTFVIPAAEVSHVGGYTVEAYVGPTNILSKTAFLSVYSLNGTNSTTGTLTTSASQFGTQAPPGYFCPDYPTIVFNRYYTPTNSAGAFYFFYGPYVPIGSQTGPFVNSGYNRYIRITTAGSVNTPTFTGVEYYSSFDPPGYPPYECGCESGNSVLVPDLTYYLMSFDPSEKLARYRTTIYYLTPPNPPAGRIIMNWTYF